MTPPDDSSSAQEPSLHLGRRPEDDRIDHTPVELARQVATGSALRGMLIAVSQRSIVDVTVVVMVVRTVAVIGAGIICPAGAGEYPILGSA